MTWTPLITSSMFTGLQADVLTAIGGVIGVIMSVMAAYMVIKVFRNF